MPFTEPLASLLAALEETSDSKVGKASILAASTAEPAVLANACTQAARFSLPWQTRSSRHAAALIQELEHGTRVLFAKPYRGLAGHVKRPLGHLRSRVAQRRLEQRQERCHRVRRAPARADPGRPCHW